MKRDYRIKNAASIDNISIGSILEAKTDLILPVLSSPFADIHSVEVFKGQKFKVTEVRRGWLSVKFVDRVTLSSEPGMESDGMDYGFREDKLVTSDDLILGICVLDPDGIDGVNQFKLVGVTEKGAMKKSFKVTKSTKINLNDEEYLLKKGDRIFVSSDAPSRIEIADWLFNFLLEREGEEVSIYELCANYPYDTCVLSPNFANFIDDLISDIETEYHVNIDFVDTGDDIYEYGYILTNYEV